MKKIENQIHAISDTITAAKKRINDLQRDLDALRKSHNASQVRIDRKQSELNNLKAALSSALENGLLTIVASESSVHAVRAAVRSL